MILFLKHKNFFKEVRCMLVNDSHFLMKICSNVEESPFGPLTQRLVSALIEENIMTPMDDTMNEITGGKGKMYPNKTSVGYET